MHKLLCCNVLSSVLEIKKFSDKKIQSFARLDFCVLKELKLLTRCIDFYIFLAVKEFNVGELFVCNTHYSNFSIFGKH